MIWPRRSGHPGRDPVVRHHFEIDPLDDDRSRLRQFEQFSGILVPFMRGTLRDTQAAFELANKAIKQRAESLPEERGNNNPDSVQ